jgi:tripartite-type tricarboxylate transporter receptor subunit TctC
MHAFGSGSRAPHPRFSGRRSPALALLAPRGTPAEAIHTINAGATAALADPAVRERLRALGFTATPSSPEETAQRMRADLRRYGEMVNLAGAATQ